MGPFLRPVDPKQVADYYKVIKNPTDLQTITKKLNSSGYKDKEDFFKDLKLLLDNCYTFNPADTEVYECGKAVEKVILRMFDKTHLEEELKSDKVVEKIKIAQKKMNDIKREIESLNAELNKARYEESPDKKNYTDEVRKDIQILKFIIESMLRWISI